MLVRFKLLYYLSGKSGMTSKKENHISKEFQRVAVVDDADSEEEDDDDEYDDDSEEDDMCTEEEELLGEEVEAQKRKQTIKKDEKAVAQPGLAKQKVKKEKKTEYLQAGISELLQPEKKQTPEKPNMFIRPSLNIFSTSVQNIFAKSHNPSQNLLQKPNKIFDKFKSAQQSTVTINPQQILPDQNSFFNIRANQQKKQEQKKDIFKVSQDNEQMNVFLKEYLQSSLQAIGEFIVEPKEEKQETSSTYGTYRSNCNNSYSRGNEIKKEKLYTFSISPSYAELKTYSPEKLHKISDFKIWNKYGEIIFLEEISIKDVNFQEIIIIHNKIEVLSDALRGKQKQLVFHNYLNYASVCPSDKKFLKKQILSEMKLKFYKIIYHSEYDGDLVVI